MSEFKKRYTIQGFTLREFSVQVGYTYFDQFMRICDAAGLHWNGQPHMLPSEAGVRPTYHNEIIFCNYRGVAEKHHSLLRGTPITHWGSQYENPDDYNVERPVVQYREFIEDNQEWLKSVGLEDLI